MLLFWITILILSFYLIAKVADEYFVPALEHLAKQWKFSDDMAGATLMAVGSSAPELAISLIAILSHGVESESIGAGTIIGSALFNILVIIGLSAIARTAYLVWQPILRDNLFYLVSVIWLLVSFWDGRIVLGEAVVFVGLYLLYLIAVMKWRDWFKYEDLSPVLEEEPAQKQPTEPRQTPLWKSWLSPILRAFDAIFRVLFAPGGMGWTFAMSILMIAGLSFVLVESAVHTAELLSIPPAVVALTVLAAGTSIPDLFSSLIVAKRGKGGMAISNAVGSNIFDIMIGLGVPWVIFLALNPSVTEIHVDTNNLLGSVALLLATIIATFFIYMTNKWRIGTKGGWVLIVCYVAYLVYAVGRVL